MRLLTKEEETDDAAEVTWGQGLSQLLNLVIEQISQRINKELTDSRH